MVLLYMDLSLNLIFFWFKYIKNLITEIPQNFTILRTNFSIL